MGTVAVNVSSGKQPTLSFSSFEFLPAVV